MTAPFTVDLDPTPGSRMASLAYGVYPQFRRRSVATRAVRLACRYLGARGDIDRITIDVDPANTASSAVAVRAGFRFLMHISEDEDDFDRYRLVVRQPPARGRPR